MHERNIGLTSCKKPIPIASAEERAIHARELIALRNAQKAPKRGYSQACLPNLEETSVYFYLRVIFESHRHGIIIKCCKTDSLIEC